MKQNNYLIDYKTGDWHIELCLPSYQSTNNSNLGMYWDLGISLSVGKSSVFQFRLSLLFGWLTVTKYKTYKQI